MEVPLTNTKKNQHKLEMSSILQPQRYTQVTVADPEFDLRGGGHISIKIRLKINRERSERGKK